MRKFYATLCLAMMAMTSFAQEQNDTTYVMMDFNQNPWGYPVTEVTKGWAPDYTDRESPGAILDNKDFSWPVSEGSSKKVKVTPAMNLMKQTLLRWGLTPKRQRCFTPRMEPPCALRHLMATSSERWCFIISAMPTSW